MTIFITGASGFIGGHIVQALASTHTFYAMARSEAAAEKIRALGATPVLCELGHVTPNHLAHCDTIIHAAAFAKEWGTKAEFWGPTVHGTEQLLDVAEQAGIRRFMHISTEALLFTGDDLDNIDETHPYPERTPFLYPASKLAAEKLVMERGRTGKLEVMSLRPRLVWGPDDQTVLPLLVEMVQAGRFMWVNNGQNQTSTTHIANFVEGVRCALRTWRPNEIYFITDGETTTYRTFLTHYLSTQGVCPGDKSMSKGVVRAGASLIELLWRTLGLTSKPPITKMGAYLLSANCTISHAKAARELGYCPVITVADGMAELARLAVEQPSLA